MKYILPFIALFAVAGCCTKKFCEADTPKIFISLQENTGAWLRTKVYFVDRTTSAIVDSFIPSNILYVELSETTLGAQHELAAYDYIIATDSSSDLITDVSYTVQTQTIECNECIGSRGLQDIKVFQNFSYQHEGSTYGMNDTLFIYL